MSVTDTDIQNFLITKSENIFWLTGFAGSFGFVIKTKNTTYLITDGRYAEKAEKICHSDPANAGEESLTFILYDKDFKKNFGKTLKGKFSCEATLSLSEFKRYKSLFPNINFSPKSQIIERLRRTKTNEEITKTKTAQDHIDKILAPFLKANTKAGVTEKQLAFNLEHTIRNEGKFNLAFDAIVGFGENSAIPHHSPSERRLKDGDNILIDCGAKYQGYHSDMTRNFVWGNLNLEYKNKFNLCLRAQTETLAQYKPGQPIAALEQECRKILNEESQYFTHSLGHGVGLEIHELPTVSNRTPAKEKLKAGDIVTCEPGIYYPGKFGIRIEDILVITEKGHEVLSKTPKQLIQL
jgi:Xaa-Pro aminopeptidase